VIRCPTAAACLLAAVVVAACRQAQTAPLYEKVRVQRRDIIVTATSVGMIRPILTFSVKSKAWGEILEMPVQTGEAVKAGQLLARIDPRVQRDNLAIAEANLSRAQAQLGNADAQFQRAEALYRAQAIAETDYEAAKLADVTAKAAVVTTTAYLQIAKDAMEDTQVRAPIAGTILELDAGRGTVISSPTLGGGTVILKMANLDTVQDSSLIIETDIGRVQPGMPVTTLVDAYPDHPFQGTVLKIVPQAQVVQNATKFPVLTNLPNDGGLLKPGMNTRVQVHTGQRQNVLAIPNGALRTSRDVAAAAALLGLDPTEVQKEVAAGTARPQPTAGGDTAGGTRAGAPTTFTTPSGRTITLPAGVTPEAMGALFAKTASGAVLTPAESAMLATLRGGTNRRGASGGGAAARGRGGAGRSAGSGGGSGGTSYVVFTLRGGKPVPVPIRTGLTDQDYTEVTSGLTEQDTVLVLPSASLVQSQQQMRQRFQNVTGGGLPGLRQQAASPPARQP
jgi:RND family efflux transporter MFP subunit